MTILSTRKRLFILLTVVAFSLLIGGLILAAGSPLQRSLVSSGGGLVTQGDISLNSAIGQPVAGTVINGFTLCSGFLCGAQTAAGISMIYLPVVTNPISP